MDFASTITNLLDIQLLMFLLAYALDDIFFLIMKSYYKRDIYRDIRCGLAHTYMIDRTLG